MNRTDRQWPALMKRAAGTMILVGDHDALDGFGRMAGPPADHDAAQIVLVENVPQRFRFPRKVGDRLHTGSTRRGLGEAVNRRCA